MSRVIAFSFSSSGAGPDAPAFRSGDYTQFAAPGNAASQRAAALTPTPVQPKGKGLTVFSRQREKLRGNTVPP